MCLFRGAFSKISGTRVYFADFTGFSIFNCHQTFVDEFKFPCVIDEYADEIVFSVYTSCSIKVTIIEKV